VQGRFGKGTPVDTGEDLGDSLSSSAAMPEEDHSVEICEVCQKAEATFFVCATAVSRQVSADGKVKTESKPGTSHQYCRECAQKASHDVGEDSEEMSPCYYCGGQSDGGRPNSGPEITVRKRKWHYTCRRCGIISTGYFFREMRENGPSLRGAKDEGKARFEELIRKVDDLVRAELQSGQPDETPLPPITGEMVIPEEISIDDMAALLGQSRPEIRMRLVEIRAANSFGDKLSFEDASKLLRHYGYTARKA
jgi:ribosomal protein L37E